MGLSLVIAAGIVISGFAATWLGVELIFYPPQTPAARRKVRITLAVSFVALLGFTLWATMRGERTMADLPKQVADALTRREVGAKQPSANGTPTASSVPPSTDRAEPSKPSQKSGSAATLTLDCRRLPLPISRAPGAAFNVLNSDFPDTIMEGESGAAGGPHLWPGPESHVDWIFQCTLKNYGNVSLLNISAQFKVLFSEAVPFTEGTAHGFRSGKLLSSHNCEVKIGAIDPNGTYEFYVWHAQRKFVEVIPPGEATAERSSQIGRRLTVKIVRLNTAVNGRIAMGPPSQPEQVPPSVIAQGITNAPNSMAAGINNGAMIQGDAPPQFTVSPVTENVSQANGLYETQFKVQVTTARAIVLHVKASALNLVGNLKIDDERPPGQGGKSFTSSGTSGSGYTEEDYSNIESGGYFLTVQTSQPEKVRLECR